MSEGGPVVFRVGGRGPQIERIHTSRADGARSARRMGRRLTGHAVNQHRCQGIKVARGQHLRFRADALDRQIEIFGLVGLGVKRGTDAVEADQNGVAVAIENDGVGLDAEMQEIRLVRPDQEAFNQLSILGAGTRFPLSRTSLSVHLKSKGVT